MSMSKKDYEMIAATIETNEGDHQSLILELGYAFHEENPNFRWDMWLEATGFTGLYSFTKVDNGGCIASPGKFEGEQVYMPIAYEAYLNGCDESDDPDVIEVSILFGGKERTVRFFEDNVGFVHEAYDDPENDDDQ